MKSNWTYSDIFDLEYFFYRDREIGEPQLHERDRSIYLDQKKQHGGESVSTSFLLLSWLNSNRTSLDQAEKTSLPGTLVSEALNVLAILLPLSGIILGILSGLAFFTYSGKDPVNVFHFLFLFVFSQLMMLLILLIRQLLKQIGLFHHSFPSLFKLYTSLTARLASKMQARLRSSISGSHRAVYQQVLGLAKTVHYKYGQLLYWPFFNFSQRTLIGFNAGLLAASLFRITTSDLAFGWQSTIQFSSSALYQGVKMLALPWSWLLPADIAYPSLAAIEGSRIILKDGIYHLATQDLVAWWPFLILCLLVYGLLVRIILMITGQLTQRHRLKTIRLDNADVLSVLRRMQSPLVSTQAKEDVHESPQQKQHHLDSSRQSHTELTDLSTPFPLILLIAADISQQSTSEKTISFLEKHGFTIREENVMMQDYASDQLLLQRIGASKPANNTGIFLLMEAWMPPIGETIEFIKNLRSVVHTATPIYVGLIGKPDDDKHFASPRAEDLKIWKQKLDAESDPYLKMFPFTRDDNS